MNAEIIIQITLGLISISMTVLIPITLFVANTLLKILRRLDDRLDDHELRITTAEKTIFVHDKKLERLEPTR